MSDAEDRLHAHSKAHPKRSWIVLAVGVATVVGLGAFIRARGAVTSGAAERRGRALGPTRSAIAAAIGVGRMLKELEDQIAELRRSDEAARESQAALRETERLYRAVARNLPHGVVAVFDRSLTYLLVEGKGLGDLGLEREQIEGQTTKIWPPKVRALIETEFLKALAGEASTSEIPFAGRTYLVHVIPLLEANGQVEQGLMLAQDVSMLKDVQSQLEDARLRLEDANALLRQMSETDALLGIANRRKFDNALGAEWRRAMRGRLPLALLMIDVDFFKAFNDAYGHAPGDECLQRIAAAVADAVQRPGDLVARYGGEELAVLLPMTEAEGAREIADRIHESLASAAIFHGWSSVCPNVTVSVGLSACRVEEPLREIDLLMAADEALYKAKAAGRNCTCEEPVRSAEVGRRPPRPHDYHAAS